MDVLSANIDYIKRRAKVVDANINYYESKIKFHEKALIDAEIEAYELDKIIRHLENYERNPD